MALPHANDCNALTRSFSGIAVSWLISYRKKEFRISKLWATLKDDLYGGIHIKYPIVLLEISTASTWFQLEDGKERIMNGKYNKDKK